MVYKNTEQRLYNGYGSNESTNQQSFVIVQSMVVVEVFQPSINNGVQKQISTIITNQQCRMPFLPQAV